MQKLGDKNRSKRRGFETLRDEVGKKLGGEGRNPRSESV